MFSTSVREGRGGEETCEWKTASSYPSSSRNHVSGPTSSSNRYGEAAALRPGTYRSATPSRSTTSPQASFGDSARACSSSADRVSAGITTESSPPDRALHRPLDVVGLPEG